jgi:hypothetical protein
MPGGRPGGHLYTCAIRVAEGVAELQ